MVVLTAGTAPPVWNSESNVEALIRQAQVPLLILRPTDEWRSRGTRLQRLLVCLDGSESAERVIRYARFFARQFGGSLFLLGVPEAESETARLREYVASVAEALKKLSLEVQPLISGAEPAVAIVEMARELGIDLIVLATSGRGGASRHSVFGSVAGEMIRVTPCPLLMVPVVTRNG